MAVRQGQAGIDADERNERLAARLLSLECLQRAAQVVAYMPIRGEADPRPAIQALWANGAEVLLPRCRPGEAGRMDLGACTCYDELVKGSYGILEPRADVCRPLSSLQPDVVLVPGVGFTPKGKRLGFGGGYYDRLLENPVFSNSLFVGLAYDFQVVEDVPSESWDVVMHMIVTDERTIEVHPC